MLQQRRMSPEQPTASFTMTGAVFTGTQGISLERIAIPEPGPTQVRVRLEGCGVCASNLPVWEGRSWFDYPLSPGQPGHEGWGYIDALGTEITHFNVGDRVAILSEHAYAEYDVAAADAVIRLPDALADQPVPGEPLGCAINVFRRAGVSPGQTVAIVGIGFLGSLLTALAAQAGARVIAISRRPFALETARDMGAAETIPMDDHWQIIERVKQLTAGKGCDCVIEAIGKQWPLDLAAELTRERGRLIIAGYHQDGPRQVNMQLWNWRGLDVINAHERDQNVYIEGIQLAIEAIVKGKLNPLPLYTHMYSLANLSNALQATQERPPDFMKAIISFSEPVTTFKDLT